MLAPLKTSYEQPRQHIEKQRSYFSNNCLSSQGYGSSSSHVWVWELDYKESWVLKNWCFWTAVLEETLFLLLFIYFFNWMLITLQYCSVFCHTLTWIIHGCTCAPHPEPLSHLPTHPIPQGHPSAPALSTLLHALNLDWWSVSHMLIYIFQCYSVKSSHPRLLPQSPKDCSIHLCLFCCLAYRVIITIFLNSIYMCQYTILVFFFLTYFTLYNRLQFHPPH